MLLSIELCEQKTLMTSGLSRGVLTVLGTKLDDVIEVRRAPANSQLIQVLENGKLTFSKNASRIKQIRINVGAGDDDVTVNQTNGKIAIPTSLFGSKGNDKFQGGSGLNQIDGGQGLNAYKPSSGQDRVINAARIDQVVKLGSTNAFRNFLTHSSKGRSGFGIFRGPVNDVGIAAPSSSPSANSPSSKISAPGYSQTNTQVAGIDEADIIENDGRYLYVLSRKELLIVDAGNADAPKVVSRTAIDGWPVAEYLYNGHLTVISSVWNTDNSTGGPDGIMPLLRIRGSSQVQVTVYDVTDQAAPKVLSQTKLDGNYSDSRMVDGKLTLIVQNDLLSGYWGGIYRPMVKFATGLLAPVNQVSNTTLEKLIQKTPIEKLLPTWSSTTIDSAGAKVASSGLISQPQDLYCPVVGNEANLMSVVLLDTTSASPSILGSTSVIGGYASTIFMNSKDLYIFSPQWDSTTGESTNVQRFDITSGTPELVSTGSFQGQLLNQFSADAQGNLLRVATSSWTDSGRANALYVLTTEGDTIKTIGAVTGIAPGESITSARFVGDMAYLVTFRQTDPLFTIDLSTPTAPKIVGELKLPGFSRYLQPLGEGYLVGIGRDADPATGRTLGLKVSLFDVRDAAAPAEVASYLISQPSDGWSWSDAEWDHHALGYFPELDVIAVPVQGYVPGTPDPKDPNGYVSYIQKSDLLLLKVDPATGISQLGTIEQNSTLLRSARIGDVVYSVADLDMKAAQVLTDGLVARGSVDLQKPYDGSGIGGVIYY